MPDNQTCGNCKWSSGWTMTKHAKPRINERHHGICDFPIVMPDLPICTAINGPYKSAIWPRWSDCSCWAAKEASDGK